MKWHYTTNKHIGNIIKDGRINLSKYGVDSPRWYATWVSSNPVFEPTSCRPALRYPSGKIKMIPWQSPGMSYRIAVDDETCPLNFNQYVKRCKVNDSHRLHLLTRAKKHGGKPSEWFCALTTITQDKWLTIERYVNGWQVLTTEERTAARAP